jgi:hypothetical protein
MLAPCIGGYHRHPKQSVRPHLLRDSFYCRTAVVGLVHDLDLAVCGRHRSCSRVIRLLVAPVVRTVPNSKQCTDHDKKYETDIDRIRGMHDVSAASHVHCAQSKQRVICKKRLETQKLLRKPAPITAPCISQSPFQRRQQPFHTHANIAP